MIGAGAEESKKSEPSFLCQKFAPRDTVKIKSVTFCIQTNFNFPHDALADGSSHTMPCFCAYTGHSA